jgi:hypothetical protein
MGCVESSMASIGFSWETEAWMAGIGDQAVYLLASKVHLLLTDIGTYLSTCVEAVIS